MGAQTAAMLVLSPIFEADLQPEQYAYRPGRGAHDAVRRVHRLLNTGHREVVDADLSDYYGQIPHSDLLRSIARRVSDGRLLGWVKSWSGDGRRGGRRARGGPPPDRTGRVASGRAPRRGRAISPLFSNIYMRRFILGWKVLGYARRFEAEIVNYADDFAVLGKAPAAEMLAGGRSTDEAFEVAHQRRGRPAAAGYPITSMTFPATGLDATTAGTPGAPTSARAPSPASVQSICRRVSELTTRRDGLLPPGDVVARLNRLLTGWANYFILVQVSPAYAAIDRHATRRLRQWLCRKHQVRSGPYVRFPDERLWKEYGLTRLGTRTTSLPWAKA